MKTFQSTEAKQIDLSIHSYCKFVYTDALYNLLQLMPWCMPTIYGSNNFCAKGAKYECSDIGFMYSHIKSIQRHTWQIILWLQSFLKEHYIWWLRVSIILPVMIIMESSRKMINISFLSLNITECWKILLA